MSNSDAHNQAIKLWNSTWEFRNQPHWAEYCDGNGETIWKHSDYMPSLLEQSTALKIVRKNEDGSFQYVKDRDGGKCGIMTEQEEKEFIFTMIVAERTIEGWWTPHMLSWPRSVGKRLTCFSS